MKFKPSSDDDKDDLRRTESSGFGFSSNEQVPMGKKRLPLIKPRRFLEGNWYPTVNIPMYHKGNSNTIAEGTGTKKFETVEKGVRMIAFAKVFPLSRVPVDPKSIFKIRGDSASLIIVPIVWRFNLESITAYEKRMKDAGSSSSSNNSHYCDTIGEEISTVNSISNKITKQYKHIDPKVALTTDPLNNKPSLVSSEVPLKNSTIGETIKQLNVYYSLSKKNRGVYGSEFYSDDDDDSDSDSDDDKKIGDKLSGQSSTNIDGDGDNHDYSSNKRSNNNLLGKQKQKPKHMLNIAIKFKNGHIRWFSWIDFINYENSDDISVSEKSQIRQAINILEKSQPETWQLLYRFNK